MADPAFGLVAIGNALVDVLASVPHDFVAQHGLTPGSMNLIDAATVDRLHSALSHTVDSPGGSAGNTVAGYASFGGKAAYIGKVADDPMGGIFGRELRAMGVTFDTDYLHGGGHTGRCLVLVTPDGQRTMNTFLGAAIELRPSDVDETTVANAAVTYLEGYLFDPPHAKEAFRYAVKIAREAGRKVALSLSDSFCVERHRGDFLNLIEGGVDLLFANEAEILSLTQTTRLPDAIAAVKAKSLTTAITCGAQGAVIIANGETVTVPAAPVSAIVDSTGAGDQFAAGFLYGYTKGRALAECGKLGALAAAEVIQHMGPRPEVSYAEFLKKAA